MSTFSEVVAGAGELNGTPSIITIPNTATVTINIINPQTATITAPKPEPETPYLDSQTPEEAPPIIFTNTQSVAGTLANLLPTATVLIYQTLTPPFSNYGQCVAINKYLIAFATGIAAAVCFLSSFTDTVAGKDIHGNSYSGYGIATPNGLYVFTACPAEERKKYRKIKKLAVSFSDCVHAVVSVSVFLAIAFSDTNVHTCLLPDAGANQFEIMMNLPVAAWVLANFLFALMPATRRGVGYADNTASKSEDKNRKTSVFLDFLKKLGNLENLLPTGTVLAFQALTPSFSNNGDCRASNKYLVGSAMGLNAIICFVSSFTDSVVDGNGRLYYGLATPYGLHISTSDNTVKNKYRVMDKYRLKIEDLVHGVVSLFVFLAIGFSSGDVHECYFPNVEEGARRVVVMCLPLGALVFASALFAWIPTKRRGIGYADPQLNYKTGAKEEEEEEEHAKEQVEMKNGEQKDVELTKQS